jgi:hypothetical protein
VKWDEIFTKEQLDLLDKYNNPTVTEIRILSENLGIDKKLLAEYYFDKILNGSNRSNLN